MIEKLKKVEFHDSSLLSLNIDFSHKIIKLAVEQEVDAPYITLLFEEVSNINIEKIVELTDFDFLDIYGADFLNNNGSYIAKFTFLLGFGKPSWELSFSFERCALER